jgi:hypothetical protein
MARRCGAPITSRRGERISAWYPTTAARLTAPEDVRVATARRDGSLRRPRIIGDVAVGHRVFVRSTNGRGADWFRAAIATGRGRIEGGGAAYDVVFVDAAESDPSRVDAAYRTKHGAYAAIVDHLIGPGPRAATLEVLPALDPTPSR